MTAGGRPPPGLAGDDTRWFWVLFALAWVLNLQASLAGWDAGLWRLNNFREVQTALATAYFPPDRFPLAYELPLFGPPWELPLEFPLYQASVAWFGHLTGIGLEPAGRTVSWLYFQAGLPAIYLLLGSAGIRRPLRWITLALVVTSPIYIFYSRSFLIESLAWCGGVWFLAAFARLLERPRPGWFALCWLAGSMSASVKVTTWAVFALAAAFLFTARWWSWRNAGSRAGRPALLAATALLPVVAVGLAWTWYARSVRALNPEVGFLDSHFGTWSFGDLAQRFTWNYWRRTAEVWVTGVVSEAGLAAALFLFSRAAPAIRHLAVLGLAAFLAAQLVFSNLYYVHDYYFYASAVFLVGAVGILVAGFCDDPGQPRWLRWAVPVLLLLCQLGAYGRTYRSFQLEDTSPPEYLQALRDLTDPDHVIVVLGQDWNAGTALYAGRRAVMLLAGRETNPAGIRQTLARVNPRTVGAVLLAGPFRTNAALALDAFPSLDLGPVPLLESESAGVAIWIPRARTAEVVERLPAQPYRTLAYNPPPSASDGSVTLGPREIARRREFRLMSPRPHRATGSAGFSYATAGLVPVLNAHAPFELEFRVPAGATHLDLTFGIHDTAYADAHNHTDGVTFEVVQLDTRGQSHRLQSLHLDPHSHPEHRGLQERSIPLTGTGGTVLLRAAAGPNDNLSFDWAYIGAVNFR